MFLEPTRGTFPIVSTALTNSQVHEKKVHLVLFGRGRVRRDSKPPHCSTRRASIVLSILCSTIEKRLKCILECLNIASAMLTQQ